MGHGLGIIKLSQMRVLRWRKVMSLESVVQQGNIDWTGFPLALHTPRTIYFWIEWLKHTIKRFQLVLVFPGYLLSLLNACLHCSHKRILPMDIWMWLMDHQSLVMMRIQGTFHCRMKIFTLYQRWRMSRWHQRRNPLLQQETPYLGAFVLLQ